MLIEQPETLGVVGDARPAANSPRLVRLVDGREVSNVSEEWRLECLARWVLAMPLEDRRAWMWGAWIDVREAGKPRTQVRKGGMLQRQGAAAVRSLEEVMTAICKARSRRRKAA